MKAIMISLSSKECLNLLKRDLSILVREDKKLCVAIQKLIKEQGNCEIYSYATPEKPLIWSYTDLDTFGVLPKRIEKQFKYFGTTAECEKALDEFIKKYNKGFSCSNGVHNQILNCKVVAKFDATSEIIDYSNCFPLSAYETELSWAGDFEYGTETLDEDELVKKSCLDNYELDDCLQGKNGTAVHIKSKTLKIFDKPKEISEFIICLEKKHKCRQKFSDYPCKKCVSMNLLTRAPHSWCYVEV